MKIYNKITMDFSGNIIHEDSYEYHGIVYLCKGGQAKAQREAQAAADRAYELQVQQMEEQKAQLAEMKRMQTEEELQKRIFNEKSLQLKRKGVTSTILTGDLGTPKIAEKSLYTSSVPSFTPGKLPVSAPMQTKNKDITIQSFLNLLINAKKKIKNPPPSFRYM